MSDSSIPLRIAKLGQLIDGRASFKSSEHNYFSKETLLDSLVALHTECQRKIKSHHGHPQRHVTHFLEKLKQTIHELRQLRLHIDDFELIKIIGQGHFGQVSVVREKLSKSVLALKTIRKSEILAQQDTAYFDEERDILLRNNSSWLTQLHYAFQDDKNLYLAMDFHPGGDLAILLSRYESLDEDMTKFYLVEMVQAIHALHLLGYVHRDVKPDNFLIDRIGHLKLTDFGSSALLDVTGKVSGRMPVGTPDYIAPELLTSMTSGGSEPRTYTLGVDWWSLGVICYEMLTGDRPFSDEESVVKTYSNIISFKEKLCFPVDCEMSATGRQFIKDLLSEADSRPDYQAILDHPYIRDIDASAIRNSTPPYIPKVTGSDDTSNFDECEPRHVSPRDHLDDKTEFRDLPFVGFTAYRNLVLMKAAHRSSAAGSSLLESLLPSRDWLPSPDSPTVSYERKEAALRHELEKLREEVLHKSERVSQLEKINSTQRQDLTYLQATNETLTEQVERLNQNLFAHKDVYDKVVSEAEDLVSVLRSNDEERHEYEANLSQELDHLKNELERMDKVIVDKDVQLLSLHKKMERLEEEDSCLRAQLSTEKQKRAAADMRAMSSRHASDKCGGTLVLKCEIETQQSMTSRRQNNETVTELLQQLDKVQEFNRETSESMERMRRQKEELERELESIKVVGSRREKDRAAHQSSGGAAQPSPQIAQRSVAQDGQPSLMLDTDRKRASQLEMRNAKLMSEISEKSQQMQQLANRIADLTNELEEALRRAADEKMNRVRLEASLHKRIETLESELRERRAENDRLLTSRDTEGDRNIGSRRVIQEQEQTIEILKANIGKLENVVSSMRDGFDDKIERRDHKGRQETRRWAEIVGELKQENMYLERKIEHLDEQMKAKVDCEATYKDRLQSARDRLAKIREESADELTNLRTRVREAESEVADLKSQVESSSRSERIMKRKLESLQAQQVDEKKLSKQRLEDVENEKSVMEQKIETLQEETELLDEYEIFIEGYKQKIETLEAENKSLGVDTQRAVESKTRSEIARDQAQTESRQTDRKYEILKEEMKKLQLLCNEMELNSDDMEKLYEEAEARIEEFEKQSDASSREIQRLQSKSERLEASLQAERNQRKSVDERSERSAASLRSQIVAIKKTEENLQAELHQSSRHLAQLKRLLNTRDSELHQLESEKKNEKVRVSQLKDELNKVKEEASTWKSQVENLKAENCKLTSDLELILDQIDDLYSSKNRIESSMENLVLTKECEKYKTEQIIGQQTKLIEYLQDKYQMPIRKKRSGSKLFTHKRKETQRDEFTSALESERLRTRKLRNEVQDLKTELLKTKVSTMGGRDLSTIASSDSGVECSTPSKPKPDLSKTTMRHNIPHRVSVGINTRATRCSVCQHNVMFGRQAAKCQECRLVTHEQCQSKLPATCGLPSQFIRLFEKTLEKQKNLNSAGGVLEADLRLIQLGAWMKVRECGDNEWEKRFVLLENETLSFYLTDDTSTRPLSHFDLCPSDHTSSTNLISDVNPAELRETSPSDLPYILKLELCSAKRSSQRSRYVYLMCASFDEKEKWDSTLDAIVTRGNMNANQQETKLLGNRLLRLDGSMRLDINCSLLIGEQDFLLLGADDGLYTVRLAVTSQPMVKVEGVTAVYQILHLKIPDMLILIGGSQRSLSTIGYSSLKDSLTGVENAVTGHVKAQSTRLLGMSNVSMYKASEWNGTCSVVIASPDTLSVIQYSQRRAEFNVVQEVTLREPVSCLCWIPEAVLFGTDNVYKMSLHSGSVRSFLANGVKQEESYKSFPIEILELRDDEHLICFTDVGIFVNDSGQRSRDEDIQWAGVPLSFAYRRPYLYVIYYKAMQVIGPLDTATVSWRNLQTFLNIHSPRYLGPAYTEGAIYISSSHNNDLDLLVFKGNLSVPVEQYETDNSDATSLSSVDTLDSERRYLSQERVAREYYQADTSPTRPRPPPRGTPSGNTSGASRWDKENRRRREVLQQFVLARAPLRYLQAPFPSEPSSATESSSDERMTRALARPAAALNEQYYVSMYGLKSKPHDDKPHHSDV